RQGEILGDRVAYVRERLARAKIYSQARVLAEDHQGRVFARVICAGVSRIISVIGGNDQEIIVAHRALNLWPARIEMLERARIALGVAAMAVEQVEIKQVRKDYAPGIVRQGADLLID